MKNRYFLLAAGLLLSLWANAARIPMYAAYHPQVNDHFYTTSAWEHSYALSLGFHDIGIAFYVEDSAASGALPFYRFYNPTVTDHFYTTSTTERDLVTTWGWSAEGNEGFLFGSQVQGSVPVYRFSYYDMNTGDLSHFYTVDEFEFRTRPAAGWNYDGIAGYAFTRSGVADGFKAAILVYHTGEAGDCYGYSAANKALERDLAMMHGNGFTVVPLRWMVDWAIGVRPNTQMPSKPVAITLDDGYDLDYLDYSHPNCSNLPSARTVLANAPASLFAASPRATAFVIASPRARSADTLWYLHDWWWAAAQAEGTIEIQNHSADHDSGAVYSQMLESAPGFGGPIYIPVGGMQNNSWQGASSFCRIGQPGIHDPDGSITAHWEIVMAANYIQSVTGARPTMFANPTGGLSSGLRNWWNTASHGHYAAFAATGSYVMHNSHWRYDIPRMVKGSPAAGDWHSSEGALRNLLNGNGRENPSALPASVWCP